MTVKITIEADTMSEALEEARELGGEGPGSQQVTCAQTAEQYGEGSELHLAAKEAMELIDPNVEMHIVPGSPIQVAPLEMVSHPVATGPVPPSVITATSEPTRDARGIPWDARIHGGTMSNKATTKDGAWKKRRGVDPVELARVEAELKVAALPTVGAAPPPPPPETEPLPVTFGQLLAAADQDIAVLNDALSTVSGGEITSISLVADKAAWIQAVYDYLQQRS